MKLMVVKVEEVPSDSDSQTVVTTAVAMAMRVVKQTERRIGEGGRVCLTISG